MKIDSVERSSRTRIICSKEESLKSAQEIGNRKKETPVSRHNDYHDPLYYGYYGYNDYFFYSWLWSDMCHDHSIHVQDVSLVTETGGDLLEVDEKGVDMAAQEPAELVEAAEAAESASFDGGGTADGSDSGGFFDSGDSGGSSCASSCGSSCGGCGGD